MAAIATILLAACAGAPPPTVTPRGEDRFLIDPRTGYAPAQPNAGIERRFQIAWGEFLAGDYEQARHDLDEVLTRSPNYLPAQLGLAAVNIREERLDVARATVDRLRQAVPTYTAAQVYAAEIAIAEHRTRDAYNAYREIAQRPDAPPTAHERLDMLQQSLYQELYTASQAAPSEQAIRLLREALLLNPGANDARIALASRLVAQRAFAEARQVIDPVLNTSAASQPAVQEVLAEVDAGRGRYQEAIATYERLRRTNPDPRYTQRLEQIKEQWNLANMPPQYQRAIESEAITRADFAVLTYWTLTSVRFAQNLSTPPIAIDIEGVPGRDEVIRALAIGLYDVDPVTRSVYPMRVLNASTLARVAARLLTVRGASCARGLPPDPTEMARAQRVLASCGVTDPLATLPPDSPVSGRTAAAMLQQIDTALAK